MSESPLTPGQIRAARQLLSWTASKLATRVGVREKTILAFELGDQWSPPLDLGLVRRRLEAAGAEFIAENGGRAGVRLEEGDEMTITACLEGAARSLRAKAASRKESAPANRPPSRCR